MHTPLPQTRPPNRFAPGDGGRTEGDPSDWISQPQGGLRAGGGRRRWRAVDCLGCREAGGNKLRSLAAHGRSLLPPRLGGGAVSCSLPSDPAREGEAGRPEPRAARSAGAGVTPAWPHASSGGRGHSSRPGGPPQCSASAHECPGALGETQVRFPSRARKEPGTRVQGCSPGAGPTPSLLLANQRRHPF